MIRKLLFSLVYIIPLLSCTKDNSKISVACQLMPNGTYMIKWETFPPMKGTVKIYESLQPDSFNLCSPIAELDIQKGYVPVLGTPSAPRSYFNLIFNNKQSVITAQRVLPMQGIFNFRDMGGYVNKENRSIRWGKLYRSGSIAMASPYDRKMLNILGIKTIIDLRTQRESLTFPIIYRSPQVYNLPLRGNRHDIFFNQILARKMERSAILSYDQSIFNFIIENNSDYFINLFDILLEEKNYPVVIYCSLGKDRTAIAAALILAALEMDSDLILDDYLLSNKEINYHALVRNSEAYPEDVLENFTALFSAHEETINRSFDALIANYGSIDNYFEQELKLTDQKREKLKGLLLYSK